MAATCKTNRKPTSSRARKRRLALQHANALNFETLEARQMLASVTVGNSTDVLSPTANTTSITALMANDGGDGISLREAITAANNTAGADSITFDPSVFSVQTTIDIASQLPTISQALTIAGPGADLLTIDAGDGTDNIVDTGDGYRIFEFNDGIDSNKIDVTISGLTLTGGDISGNGGAIFNAESLTLTDSVLDDNHASSRGGAILNLAPSGQQANLVLQRSTVSGNTSGDDGGGIANFGVARITNSTLSGNISGDVGGGVYTYFYDLSEITNSTLSGNHAVNGGGVSNKNGTVRLVSSTLTLNTATTSGGGVFNFNASATTHATNSIVAGNTANSNVFGSLATKSSNLLSGDPKLGPLADNGGPTQTHALLSGSPALDAGSTIPNGSFEDAGGSLNNWTPVNNAILSLAQANDGTYSAQISGHVAGFSVLAAQGLAVEAGSEVVAQVQTLVDTTLPAGQFGELKIEFYSVFGAAFEDRIGESIVIAANASTPTGSWNLVENIATAPDGPSFEPW